MNCILHVQGEFLAFQDTHHFQKWKKKHVPIHENLYVYSHLKPAAMEKVYKDFIKAWENFH
ncbi:hypothetical protein A4U60_08415 [Priestia endophytica]|nr:hypothetical protein A4U60_08415 [Priestia endophytica]